MAPILTAEDVVRRIAAECAYVDERGGVGIRLEPAAAIVRRYGEQFRLELKPDFEVAIYHNINVDQDRDRAFAEAKRFLDSYYSVDYRQDMLKLWVAAGSPAQCVQSLQRYVDAGATTILLRVVGYDQKGQFKRVTEEILPAFS